MIKCKYCNEDIDSKAKVCKHCGKNVRFILWDFLNASFFVWFISIIVTGLITLLANNLISNWDSIVHKNDLKKEINFRINNTFSYLTKSENFKFQDGWKNRDSVTILYKMICTSLFYSNPEAINYFDSLNLNEMYKEQSLPKLLIKYNDRLCKHNLTKLKKVKVYLDQHLIPDPGTYHNLHEMIFNLDTLK